MSIILTSPCAKATTLPVAYVSLRHTDGKSRGSVWLQRRLLRKCRFVWVCVWWTRQFGYSGHKIILLHKSFFSSFFKAGKVAKISSLSFGCVKSSCTTFCAKIIIRLSRCGLLVYLSLYSNTQPELQYFI